MTDHQQATDTAADTASEAAAARAAAIAALGSNGDQHQDHPGVVYDGLERGRIAARARTSADTRIRATDLHTRSRTVKQG